MLLVSEMTFSDYLEAVKKGHPINRNHALAAYAAQFEGVKEEGINSGRWVKAFQRAVDGRAEGEPWCCAFVNYCLKGVDPLGNGPSKVFRSENCWMTWQTTPMSLRVSGPKTGVLSLWNVPGTQKGHIGIVSAWDGGDTFRAWEGNTSEGTGGSQREGDGVFLRQRAVAGYPKFALLGFLLPFPEPVTLA